MPDDMMATAAEQAAMEHGTPLAGVSREILVDEDAAAERLFTDLARAADAELVAAAAWDEVAPQIEGGREPTAEEGAIFKRWGRAQRALAQAERAMIRYPFIRRRHHEQKLSYIDANPHLRCDEASCMRIVAGLVAALAVIHEGDSQGG